MPYNGNVQGWILGPNALSWDDAEAYCVSQGSHLATITDSTEQEEAKAVCEFETSNDIDSHGCWIGLYYDAATSTWNWQDGSSLGLFGFDSDGNTVSGYPWGAGEPNSIGEECIHLYKGASFDWNDHLCQLLSHPLCNDPSLEYIISYI